MPRIPFDGGKKVRRLDGQPKRRNPEQWARSRATSLAKGLRNTPTKVCPDCQGEFPRAEFGIRPKTGYSGSYCRGCAAKRARARFLIQSKKPEWRERMAWLNRRTVLRINYGLADAQGGVCKICKGPPTRKYLDVDHCHDSKQIRGLLCSACNTSVGLMREDPALFHAAAEYVSGFHIKTKRAS